MPSTNELPVFNIPEAPSFLVKEGKVFKITELNCDASKAFKSIDKWYIHKVKEAIEPFIRQRASQEQDDITSQIAHIEKHNQVGKVIVPQDLCSIPAPLMVFNSKVYPVKLIDYNPQIATISHYFVYEKAKWLERAEDSTKVKYTQLKAMWDKIKPSLASELLIDIQLKQDLVRFPCTVAYVKHIERLVCYPRTFHTYSDYKLCTGNASAKNFWENPMFLANFNSINFMSIAYEIQTPIRMLQDEYIVSWKLREESSWTA